MLCCALLCGFNVLCVAVTICNSCGVTGSGRCQIGSDARAVFGCTVMLFDVRSCNFRGWFLWQYRISWELQASRAMLCCEMYCCNNMQSLWRNRNLQKPPGGHQRTCSDVLSCILLCGCATPVADPCGTTVSCGSQGVGSDASVLCYDVLCVNAPSAAPVAVQDLAEAAGLAPTHVACHAVLCVAVQLCNPLWPYRNLQKPLGWHRRTCAPISVWTASPDCALTLRPVSSNPAVAQMPSWHSTARCVNHGIHNVHLDVVLVLCFCAACLKQFGGCSDAFVAQNGKVRHSGIM